MDKDEEIEIKIPSIEEQMKIMEEIQREETLDRSSFQRRDLDEIYVEDDPQKALEKLLKISKLEHTERMAYIKRFVTIVIEANAIDQIEVINQSILQDSDEVKKLLLYQYNELAHFLHKNNQTLFKSVIINTLVYLLYYNNLDIKIQAAQELSKLVSLLKDDEKHEYIEKQISNMSKADKVEQIIIVEVCLLGNLAEFYGEAKTESFLAPEILSKGESEFQSVKKETIKQIVQISKFVSQKFFVSTLLPFYLNKCSETQWQIRKACSDVFNEICTFCPLEVRENELTNQFLKFFKDNNRWIKEQAYKLIGPFIRTLKGAQKVCPLIFEEFLKLPSPALKECFTENNEGLAICSEYFATVLQVFGSGKWPQLSKIFMLMQKCGDQKVRMPLSYSLHEIGISLGPAISETELIPVLDIILKDPRENIRLGVIKNYHHFLSIFPSDIREDLLDIFMLLQKEHQKWYVRHLLAKQIGPLCKLFSREMIFQVIVPISLKFCNDVVYKVRKAAAKRMYLVIEGLQGKDDSDYLTCILENIKLFAKSKRFNQRQVFAIMCQNLMNLECFESELITNFEDLVNDQVKNVKISTAISISNHIKMNGRLKNDPRIKQMEKKLNDENIFNLIH